jgi:hypothetical protein
MRNVALLQAAKEMSMLRAIRRLSLLAMGVLACWPTNVQAGWSVGVRLGFPIYFGPCYPSYYYYRPYPVVVAPPPVVVAPAPVYQAVPAVQPVYQTTTAAPPAAPGYQTSPAQAAPPSNQMTTVHTTAADDRLREINHYIQHLTDPDERTRAEVVMQLGRLHDPRAIEPLAATLASDGSPAVRESAARALGLIGSAQAVPALQRAAQLDTDRDVRRSAQFAAEILQSR